MPIGLFIPMILFLALSAFLLGVTLAKGACRHLILSWGLLFLIALTVGIIVDLHRPLYGIVHVDQHSKLAVKNRMI